MLFVTPEYNRSIPGALKNALDVGSRPYGHSIWSKKPAAIVSVSPGALAAFGANHHLRQPLVFLGMPTMQQPEAYIGNVADLLDDNGKLKKDDTRNPQGLHRRLRGLDRQDEGLTIRGEPFWVFWTRWAISLATKSLSCDGGTVRAEWLYKVSR